MVLGIQRMTDFGNISPVFPMAMGSIPSSLVVIVFKYPGEMSVVRLFDLSCRSEAGNLRQLKECFPPLTRSRNFTGTSYRKAAFCRGRRSERPEDT